MPMRKGLWHHFLTHPHLLLKLKYTVLADQHKEKWKIKFVELLSEICPASETTKHRKNHCELCYMARVLQEPETRNLYFTIILGTYSKK